MRCGRSGKFHGVAEPAVADARVRDAEEAVRRRGRGELPGSVQGV